MAPAIDAGRLFGLQPAVSLVSVAAVLILGYAAASIIHNLFVSPLRVIPGPKLWAVSSLPYAKLILDGDGHRRMRELHRRYGEAVRVGPNQVAFADPKAWRDLMGHRKAGGLENGRDPVFYSLARDSVIGPISSEDHGRQRRVLSHGFSAQSMQDQQPLIQKYVDLLLERLREHSEAGARALDMTRWYNYVTFDIIGDLSFGEPFDCLKESNYHPWISLLFAGVKQGTYLAQLRRVWPALDRFIQKHLMKYFVGKREQHQQYSRLKVEKRKALQQDRPDFMRAMLAKDSEGRDKMTPLEIQKNAALLILAGSETTATVLSGVTYLLGTNPDVLAKLAEEVRSEFSSEEEISLLSVQKLKYMLAVLDESMRMYPPVPGASPRVIHEGGDFVCDKFLPAQTVVHLWQWAMYRSPENFTLPDSFIPERWLGDARFTNDKKDALQPFVFGPRNCIGKNLAYAEMRLILARIIWNFDIKMADAQEDWIDVQESYGLWEKPPLNVYLFPRKP